MNRSLAGCGVLLILPVSKPGHNCRIPGKPPASATHAPAGTSPARVYDVEGAWFAGKGQLKCAAAAFQHALELEPKSAEAHFDLGLVRQSQKQEAAAIEEFRLALRYDPGLLPARLRVRFGAERPGRGGSRISQGPRPGFEFVCALDGLAQLLLTGDGTMPR